jgi:FkbM family methyltransferase
MLKQLFSSFRIVRRLRRRFGIQGAIGIARARHAHRFPSSSCISLRLPGLKGPLYLRPGTSDWQVFWQVFISEEYSCGVDGTNDPKLIVDCGANIGCTTVYFASRFPGARIVAVEPDESNFQLLLRNTSSYPTVHCIRAALWHSTERLVIANPTAEKFAFSVKRAPEDCASAVEGRQLSDIIGNDTEVDILKCDIEGAEREVFSSNYESWLYRTKTILIELHDRIHSGCSQTFYRAIVSRPFEQRVKGEIVCVDFSNGGPSENADRTHPDETANCRQSPAVD